MSSSLRRLVPAAASAALLSIVGSASLAQAAPGPRPCEARGCVVVSRADVDGDGRADATSLTPTRHRGAAAHVLRTVTATGQVAQTTLRTPWLFGEKPWFGAARIDGAPGAELVLRTGYGAHTQFFGVYTWRGGKLLAQRDPATRSSAWVTDGAWSVSQGYRVTGTGANRRLVATSLTRDDRNRSRFTGTATTFAWRQGAWAKASTRKLSVADGSATVGRAYGWHVAGLPTG